MEKTVDIEKLLAEGNTIQIKPKGWSMYPMMRPGRDEAVIAPADTKKLKRGDVVLYRRKAGILVLHRIWKANKEGLFLVGDNQVEIEGPVNREQVKGKLAAFVRNGKSISVKNPAYRVPAALWLRLRPVRNGIKRPAAWMRKKFLKSYKE